MVGVEQSQQNESLGGRLWRKLFRFSFTRSKLSTRNLDRFCRDTATDEPTLVIHSEDVDYKPFFPNGYAVTKRRDVPADMHVDLYYTEISKIPSESYNVVFCTGLLEHLPDPAAFIAEVHRILKPGGRFIVSASAVFSFHECPNNFFHFTPFGFRLLFKDWSKIDMLRGASQPFETIGILLQRIHLQCDIFPPVRPFIEILFHTMRFLDFFVIRQYNTTEFRDERSLTDSMLPSNMQAVVIK